MNRQRKTQGSFDPNRFDGRNTLRTRFEDLCGLASNQWYEFRRVFARAGRLTREIVMDAFKKRKR